MANGTSPAETAEALPAEEPLLPLIVTGMAYAYIAIRPMLSIMPGSDMLGTTFIFPVAPILFRTISLNTATKGCVLTVIPTLFRTTSLKIIP